MDNAIYTFSSPRFQRFSLPSDLISHILRDPSSARGLGKLYQTCKYFFSKKPIFILDKYVHDDGDRIWFGLNHDMKIPIWLTDKLNLAASNCVFPLHQIYRCTVEILNVGSCFSMTYNEFEFLVRENTIKRFWFSGDIRYSKWQKVPFDVILKKLPNATNFYFKDEMLIFSSETFKNMAICKSWNKFQRFQLRINFIEDKFDPLPLCEFIKINADSNSLFKFEIDGVNSEKTYNIFDCAVTNLLESWLDEKPKVEIIHIRERKYGR